MLVVHKMILTQAPLRISFVGGGTDLPDFYTKYPGRVISTTIDKYVHVAINRTPLIRSISARYSISETVSHPSALQHTRIRAALLDMGIESNIEIGSFASIPAKTGLGSSSSFSVALLRGLYAFQGKKIDAPSVAELAARLEINLLHEPIGKQDQYAAAIGGFNIFTFNPDHTVTIEPVLIDFKKKIELQDHMSVFYTGITRNASSVLEGQKANIDNKMETLKKMSDSVIEFADRLVTADFKGLGNMLHEGWLSKKSLTGGVSNSTIDLIYQAGMNEGAWGGKVIGAGGGGCVMFLSPQEKKSAICHAVAKVAAQEGLNDFVELPIQFVQSGAQVIFNGDKHFTSLS
jgi:D-glycero-alpha-D-manno-heptose-7-phosphate kinase